MRFDWHLKYIPLAFPTLTREHGHLSFLLQISDVTCFCWLINLTYCLQIHGAQLFILNRFPIYRWHKFTWLLNNVNWRSAWRITFYHCNSSSQLVNLLTLVFFEEWHSFAGFGATDNRGLTLNQNSYLIFLGLILTYFSLQHLGCSVLLLLHIISNKKPSLISFPTAHEGNLSLQFKPVFLFFLLLCFVVDVLALKDLFLCICGKCVYYLDFSSELLKNKIKPCSSRCFKHQLWCAKVCPPNFVFFKLCTFILTFFLSSLSCPDFHSFHYLVFFHNISNSGKCQAASWNGFDPLKHGQRASGGVL